MKLVRGLGIFSVISIACGAMLAGLLVLPAYAAQYTGPSVFFAFLLAGILFLPATLSKSEMATAIPEAGGDYLFVDRSLGPLFSTITGLGMFLTFTLKTAFALAGMSAYLLFVVSFDPDYMMTMSAIVASVLILINYRGVKKTGTFQIMLFFVVLGALLLFAGRGSLEVSSANFRPFMTGGWNGFFTATAFVFVSYAGVTKIASVAAEIKNPEQVIPIGMLVSLGGMILLYLMVVYILVGMSPMEELLNPKYKKAPIVLIGSKVAGSYGQTIIAIVSTVALVTMANAGLLASSRYPFALAQHNQLPDVVSRIHPTFSTPSVSVLLTGILLILFVLFLPVVQLAKLASTFKLMVLGLLNVSLIIFRESDIEWYRPTFRTPLYPYVQIVGALASVILIGFLGLVPLMAAGGLILVGVTWYFVYVRDRVDREGAIHQPSPVGTDLELELFDELGRSHSSEQNSDGKSIVVPFVELQEEDLPFIERRIRLAASLCGKNEQLNVVHFFEVPDETYMTDFKSDNLIEEMIKERVSMLNHEIEPELNFDQILTSHTRAALRSYVKSHEPHWLVYRWITPSPWQFLLGKKKWWLEDFPCDLLFFNDNGRVQFQDVLVITEPGPYDGEVVYAADRVAGSYDGTVTFLNPVAGTDKARQFVSSYQEELRRLCEAPTELMSIDADDWVERVLKRASRADLLIMGGLTEETFPGFPGRELGMKIAEQAKCSVARVRSNLTSPRSVLNDSGDAEETHSPEKVVHDRISCRTISSHDKKDLFQQIADQLADGEEPDAIRRALWQRERLQDTYLENGIAFPHGLVDSISETRLRMFLLEEPVDYTEDGDRADVVIATVGPPDDRQLHLDLIGFLARVFNQSDHLKKLKSSADPDQLLHKFIMEG